jgi:hypothetical protein
MPAAWKHFLSVQLPLAGLAVAVAAQVLAVALTNVPRRLSRADDLALAVTSDPESYRILLLGDSKTSRATARFQLGGPSQVANLSTHGYIGLSGSLFLVERYLQTHPAPEHVVLAISPQLLHFENNLRLSRYHLWHTFTLPGERKFLKTYHPGMGRRDGLPAILDLQEQVVDPLISLGKQEWANMRGRGPLTIPKGWIEPDPGAHVLYSTNAELKGMVDVENGDLSVAAVNEAVLSELCELGRNKGFVLHLIWPPMPDSTHSVLAVSGALSGLEAKIRSIMNDRCRLGQIVDLNARRTYTSSSFHHDLLHLFGDGWEQLYTSDLREYLGGLLHRANPPDDNVDTRRVPLSVRGQT